MIISPIPLKWWYGLVFNGMFVLIIVGTGLVLMFRPSQLVISDSETGKIYGRWNIKNGDTFSIEFIHSVNMSPVIDTFLISGKEICPFSTRFFAYGAGMQSDLEPGQVLTRDGDSMIITGFTQSFRELQYIVGTVSDHLLSLRDEQVSLRTLCGKNAHIRIRVK
ncbi:hypothetical protein FACS1894172_01700 [Spirochaetia bacterium]|nr:hypothetical protein FACS1894164_12870 [Spirochaetia bacterium]GHU29807.1 hypothetical protein FACS1894172_01700 [Spirochaetia bacterium]